MNKIAVKWLMVANLTYGSNAVVWAQDSNSDFGKSLFVSACSNCHGINGKGKGPLSDQLKVVPPDVTVLAKKNGGVFPVSTVYEMIDGRKVIPAHGTRTMPVWGDLFAPLQLSNLKWSRRYTDARTRILAVMDYLNRIQEK